MEYAEYWNNRYADGGNSGYGSYGQQLEKKLGWLKGLDIFSITEIGCGDFNFGSSLLKEYPNATYYGCDISTVVINKNKKEYPQYNFGYMGEPIPQADLILCIDVLFHTLTDTDYARTLEALDKLSVRYLAVTAYERDQEVGLAPHVRIRKFDYKRFGEPLIREVVEEDGQLYFYLFDRSKKKGIITGPQTSIDLSKVTACLNTKDKVYPKEVLDSVACFPFGEILIKTGSDSPYGKYELFNKSKYDWIYYQDDDAICPIQALADNSKEDMINLAISQAHAEQYKNRRMSMGLGWGSFFNKSVLKELKRYTDKYGEDELFKRDTEKLLTHLVYPQNRVVLPIHSLPRALNPDRLSMEPHHYSNMDLIEERCKELL